MKCCGPKLALCGLILSFWGIVQLLLMGVFFYMESVSLIEDLPLEGEKLDTPGDFYRAAEKAYTVNAYNCWTAAFIYVITFVFSGYQFVVNSRTSLSV